LKSRLRIDTFTNLYANDVVNAELTLTEQQAEALEQLIRVWMHNARSGAHRPPLHL
jgi:hypothetical protein